MGVISNRFCDNLTTKPVIENKILVTGATGYIGGQLVPELQARGYKVRVMVRKQLDEYALRWPDVEIVQADVLDYKALRQALSGIQCAYYLIHSLNKGKKKFEEMDRQASISFRKAAEENNLKRIIYLGGLGNPKGVLSDHLRSRLHVAEELGKGKIPLTFLRSAVIIGSGSTSYRMIKNLVLNCPVFLFPSKANSQCQPIAIRDVIRYLIGCLENDETIGKTFDIGGQDVLTYQEMLKTQARLMGRKRYFFPSSVFTLNLYARITSWLTSVPFDLIKCLMESCVNDVVCQISDIKKFVPFQTLNYQEAIKGALQQEAQSIDQQNAIKKPEQWGDTEALRPPSKSKNTFSDVWHFLIHKPDIPTLIKFTSLPEKEDYSYRILQRLDIKVSDYRILNIHKIGVHVPAKYVFEELLRWNGDSTCWPNHIAKVVRKNNQLENLHIFLFGWSKYRAWIKKWLMKLKLIPLFKLNAIHFQKLPDPMAADNARYLLYESYGGYPIGVFAMYVRSSIDAQNEKEQSQLFLMVGFNFYGKEQWSKGKFINRIWEKVHDRVTSNVLFRIKKLCEWRFEKIQSGQY